MAVSVGTIRASLILQDRMTGPLKAAGQAAHKFGTKMTAMGATMSKVGASMQATGMMMSMALTLPLTLLGGAAAKTFAQFEQGMNKVRAVTGLDKVSAEFQQLQEQAEELGRTTVFSAVQASEAMGAFGLAGFKANEILGAMPGALQLAAAGQLAVGDAASITAKIMRGYGLDISEVAHMNDVLTKAFTTSNTDLVSLGEAFKMAGPVANVAGLQFEETAAALSLMADAGFQGTMGGTALRGAISRLAGAVPAVAKQLKNMGIVTMDANKQLLPMADILKQLETRGLSTGEIMQVFGQRAGPAMAALLERGSGALINMTRSLEDSGGTAERIARVQLEGLMGQWTLLKSAVEGVKIAMGEQLAPALTALLGKLTAFSGYLTNVALPAFAALPPSIQQTTIAVLALAVALGPLMTISGVLLRGFGPLVSAGGFLAKTFGNLSVRGASLTKTYKLFTTAFSKVWSLFTKVNVITGLAITAVLAINAAIKKLTGGSHSLWSVLKDVGTIVFHLGKRFTAFVMGGIKVAIDWVSKFVGGLADLFFGMEKIAQFGGWLTGRLDDLDAGAKKSSAFAKSQEEIDDAMVKGLKALDLTQQSMTGLEYVLKELSKTGDITNDEIKVMVKRAKELEKQGVPLTGMMKKLVKQFDAASEIVVETIPQIQDVTEAIEEDTEATKKATQEKNKFADAVNKLSREFTGADLQGTVNEIVASYHDMTLNGTYTTEANNRLAEALSDVADKGGKIPEGFEKIVAAYQATRAETEALTAAEKASQRMRDRFSMEKPIADAEALRATFEELKGEGELNEAQLEKFGKAALALKAGGITQLGGGLDDLALKYSTQTTQTIPSFTDAIGKVGAAFSNLATISGDEMGKVWKKAGELVTKVQAITSAIDGVKSAFKAVNSFFTGGGWANVTGMMSGLRKTVGGASGSGGLIGDVAGVGTGAVTAGPQAATAFAGFATVIGVGAVAAALLVSTWKSADELADRFSARIAAGGPHAAAMAALAVAEVKKVGIDVGGVGSTEMVEQFAHGGIVSHPTVGLLGEAGPEAVVPLDQMGNEALLSEVRGLRSELRLLPLHLRDAIILAS